MVEELLEGPELSVFALTDGLQALPLAAARDHKRVGDGDTGPNTGGMGAFSPVPPFDRRARSRSSSSRCTGRCWPSLRAAGRPSSGCSTPA